MIRKRNPKLDRPALSYKHGKNVFELPQQVGFTEDGADVTYALSRAVELGLIRQDEVHRDVRQLDEYARWCQEEYVHFLRREAGLE